MYARYSPSGPGPDHRMTKHQRSFLVAASHRRTSPSMPPEEVEVETEWMLVQAANAAFTQSLPNDGGKRMFNHYGCRTGIALAARTSARM
jgi:hypothetical protein